MKESIIMDKQEMIMELEQLLHYINRHFTVSDKTQLISNSNYNPRAEVYACINKLINAINQY